jgi:lactoylglutathione lyase
VIFFRQILGEHMHFLHTMIRVFDLEETLHFFSLLGLKESLVFLETGTSDDKAQIELTHNWDQGEPYSDGRNFGHLAFAVENIYELCQKLQDSGIKILRPPRDGRMAFVRSPDNISIELLQIGNPLASQEPWASMPSTGTW